MTVRLRTALVLATCLALLGLPLAPEGTLRALRVDEHRVPLAFAADGEGAWISAPVTGESTITGLTWDDAAQAPDHAEVRVRVDGEWSRWEALPTDDEHAPDPDTDEHRAARAGTAPVVVAGADAVQFRVDADRAPDGLTADMVAVDDPDAVRRVRERPDLAEAAAERPAIHPRSDWGGESCPGPDREPIAYGDRVEALFVHHTAGHTSYGPGDVAGIIRAICSYHVNSRGWDDIGYNALIDQFGGIWEGRAGGIEEAVIGAHTGGFNSHSSGVALIGHHDRAASSGGSGAPSTAAEEALATYAAWKLDVHSVDPTTSVHLVSKGSSRWPEDESVKLDTISGHRDASYTACPGRYCYARLDPIRDRADQLGGFRIFGGWAQQHTMELQEDGTWQQPRFAFRTSEPADWTFELRDRGGRVLLRSTGQTIDGAVATVDWDATVNGKPAPKDAYTVRITARRTGDGATARPAEHVVELGGPLGEFDDVDSDNPFVDAIEWLALQRVTMGCNPPTNTRFCPDDQVTRAQMAAFLTRALELPAGDASFRDVAASHTHAPAISALADSGITMGCNPPANDRFCPEESVTRAQMASFLTRALRLDPADERFVDVPDSHTHARAIGALAASGITRGCNPPSNDRYCPSGAVTRQQMAGFLSRALS